MTDGAFTPPWSGRPRPAAGSPRRVRTADREGVGEDTPPGPRAGAPPLPTPRASYLVLVDSGAGAQQQEGQ